MSDLLGRRVERETVEQLLTQARAGRSGALVVRGEAGIGKTALLDQVRGTAAASGFQVESCAGVEAEAQFPFAGLHQLCHPLLGRLGDLPGPQQTALEVAFGLRAGPAPDRFLVGLATLTLVAEVAEEAPLLCLVDDAQWLDEASAQVLAFVARRVFAERVALLFGVRDVDADVGAGPFAGVPELRLTGLDDADARALLGAAVREALDDEVRDQIIAEARGNPLALLELPVHAQPSRLGGGFDLPGALQVPHRVEDGFRRRSAELPAETQLLLLVAAADPTGDVALLWRAAAHLGVPPEAAGPAEQAGLLQIDTRVRFRHPLVRSAVYQAAARPDRRRAHGALADATDPRDPDRHAWHRAQAVLGTDEDAATDLERSADRARARGGLAAAAAFLQRAAELTPDPGDRARRTLDAAHATHESGAFEAALDLLTVAATGPLDPLQRARLGLLRAQTAFYLAHDSDLPGMLLDAAATLAPLDPALSRETYLQALDTARLTGGLGDGRSVREVAEAARAAPPPPGPPGPVDLLLDGLVERYTRGFVAGVPRLRPALEAFCAHDPHAEVTRAGHHPVPWLLLAASTAWALFDDECTHLLTDRTVRLARESGALATLNAALRLQVTTLATSGKLAHAAELAAEQAAITQAIGAWPLRHAQLNVAAWSGNETEFTALYAACVPEATDDGDVTEVRFAQHAQAVLQNGLGNYAAALDAAERAGEADELFLASHAMPEVIEAASRAGQPERAAAALVPFDARAQASGTPWALGLAARSRALTIAGPGAEDHYREAIERLSECRMVAYLARAHLVYGEWLRREGRRQDAREQLRTAHRMLIDMGAAAFAERAARELRATGEHPRKRTAQATDALTAHEAHIARLVATGATSREVAAQLFLSPRTIEAHLRSIFRKLGITSRGQLRQLQLP